MEIQDTLVYIECYIRKVLEKFPKNEWINDNTVQFKDAKEGDLIIGNLTMTGNKIVSTGDQIDAFVKEVKKIFDGIKDKKPTKHNMKETVFAGCIERKEYFNGGDENINFLQALNKEFKKVGIEKVELGKSLNFAGTIHVTPTIHFDSTIGDDNCISEEDGHFNRLKYFLFDKFKTDFENKDDVTAVKSTSLIGLLPKEAPIDLKIDNMRVGKYYKERNFIQFYFNPFSLSRLLPTEEKLTEVFKEVFKTFKKIKIEVKDTTKIKGKIFVASFLRSARKRLNDVERGKRDTERTIVDYENNLRQMIGRMENYNSEQIYIQRNIDMNGKGMMEELVKVKKLPFVKKMDMGADFIELIFNPAIIKVNNFHRGGYKKYGIRHFYMGEIKFKITPSQFFVFNESGLFAKMSGYPHPHGSGSNEPCFGGGPGRNKIYEMLAANKFSELATLLWFWIKTYRDSGAHVHYGEFYNTILAQGAPIWDEKGNRIEINDPERIKTNEQVKVSKEECYASNIKRFEKVKLEG